MAVVSPPFDRMRWRVLLLATMLLGLLLYLPSLNGPFLYDDLRQIVNNGNLHDISNLKKVLFNGFRQIRLLQNLTFAINWSLSPGQSWSFKLFNILLHAVNSCLVAGLISAILPKRKFVIAFTAAAFLVHPLQVQSVAYVMGRVSLLEAFFYLLVLNLVARSQSRPWLISTIIVVSFMAKESCLLLPIVILAFELTVGRQTLRSLANKRTALYFSSTLLFIPIFLVLKDPVSQYVGTSGFELFPYGEYLVVQLHYYAFYLFLTLNPSYQSIIHPYPELGTKVIICAVAGLCVCAALLGLAFRTWRRRPAITFFILFFFIVLAPTNSVLQMKNPFAEYRLYLANLGLFFLMAVALETLDRISKPARLKYWIACPLLLFFAASTLHQNQIYNDSLALYQYALALYPESSELHAKVGSQQEQRQAYDKAEAHFLRAIELNEHEAARTAQPIFRLARLYLGTGRPEAALDGLRGISADMFTYGPPAAYFQLKLKILMALEREEELVLTLEEATRIYGVAPFAKIVGEGRL